MAIISQSDLNTNIYPEVITEITRRDTTLVDAAISTAVQEAKLYLDKYDLVALFGGGRTSATVQDDYLKSLVKDLACWHLLRLANTSTDLSLFRTAYQDAIAVLKSIMSGQVQPPSWPYRDTTNETAPDGDTVSWQSNPRRNNFY